MQMEMMGKEKGKEEGVYRYWKGRKGREWCWIYLHCRYGMYSAWGCDTNRIIRKTSLAPYLPIHHSKYKYLIKSTFPLSPFPFSPLLYHMYFITYN